LAQSAGQANAQLAVASAIRILGQREAAFEVDQVSKKALDLGLKGVTINHVETRIEQLLEKEKLLAGQIEVKGRMVDAVTIKEALKTEMSILSMVDAGKEKATPIVAAVDAPDRLQAASPFELNAGQLAAATLLVSSTDRIVVVQGVAGAGKSTMLQATAAVAREEGKCVLGLAFQNKMVTDLREGLKPREMSVDDMKAAGIEAQTIASFIWENQKHVANPNTAEAQAKRDEMKETLIVIDETSMVSDTDMLKLLTIADVLGNEHLGEIGDRQQLQPIDRGKSFSAQQAAGVTMARIDDNIRQRTDQLRTVAALTNAGKASQALRVLGDKVVEDNNPAEKASELWLALSPENRGITRNLRLRQGGTRHHQYDRAGWLAEGRHVEGRGFGADSPRDGQPDPRGVAICTRLQAGTDPPRPGKRCRDRAPARHVRGAAGLCQWQSRGREQRQKSAVQPTKGRSAGRPRPDAADHARKGHGS
jgi:hypothetical protein